MVGILGEVCYEHMRPTKEIETSKGTQLRVIW